MPRRPPRAGPYSRPGREDRGGSRRGELRGSRALRGLRDGLNTGADHGRLRSFLRPGAGLQPDVRPCSTQKPAAKHGRLAALVFRWLVPLSRGLPGAAPRLPVGQLAGGVQVPRVPGRLLDQCSMVVRRSVTCSVPSRLRRAAGLRRERGRGHDPIGPADLVPVKANTTSGGRCRVRHVLVLLVPGGNPRATAAGPRGGGVGGPLGGSHAQVVLRSTGISGQAQVLTKSPCARRRALLCFASYSLASRRQQRQRRAGASSSCGRPSSGTRSRRGSPGRRAPSRTGQGCGARGR